MSDLPPPGQTPPPSETPRSAMPPPTSADAPPSAARPAYLAVPVGQPPAAVGGAYYNVGLVILLSIVTFSIWTFLWSWRTGEDLKRYNGDGLGGPITLLLRFVFWPALLFTIANEVKNLYERDGRPSPVSAVWGLLFFLPLVGWIIWYVKVQHALNAFWLSKGSRQV